MEELKAQILDLPTISVKIENVEVNNAVKGDYIPSPETAEIGQTVVVKSVDENGKPTEWEAADFPESNVDVDWEDIKNKPFGEGSFEWVEIAYGNNSQAVNNSTILRASFNPAPVMKVGATYKVVVKNPMFGIVLSEFTGVGRTTTLASFPLYHIGLADAPNRASFTLGNGSIDIYLSEPVSAAYGISVTIYEYAEIVEPIPVHYLPEIPAEKLPTIPEGKLPSGVMDAVDKRHTHSNKDVLDTITSDKISKWDSNSSNMSTENPTFTGSFSLNRSSYDVIGSESHASGHSTAAVGSYSHAEGFSTVAVGNASHAEGEDTVAYGKGSHAEGWGEIQTYYLTGEANATTYKLVDGQVDFLNVGNEVYEFVNGVYNRAKIISIDKNNLTITLDKTLSSEAFNYEQVLIKIGGIAAEEYSHSEGYNTIASGKYQHVQGKYNVVDTGKYAHIVGNGDYYKRSNAHTIDWNGNGWFLGDVYVGGTSQDDASKLVSEAYVEAKGYQTEEQVNALINEALGVVENGYY